MAEKMGFLTRVATSLDWLGPNRAAIKEDESPPETGTTFSRSTDSFMVPAEYLKQIATNDDRVLAREGAQDLTLYENLLDDDVAFSNFQQRRLAVISKNWEVEPGDKDDPRSVEAADHLRMQLKQVGFDRVSNLMLFGIWFGYAVGESVWKIGSDGKVWLDEIVVPDRRWFGFTNGGELRFSPLLSSLSGEALPANKFWTVRTGATHDFAVYGLGLAHWCYWPIWFKRNVIRFWALFLEKLGKPTVLGGEDSNWTTAEKTAFMQALIAIGKDSAVKIPEDSMEKVKLIESTRSGSMASSYKDFTTEQNEALMRIILGQPGSSKAVPSGIGSGQADFHADVRAEIVKADADLLCESFNRSIAKWLTRWNFGEDVAPPLVYRVLDDEESIDNIAARDKTLADIGVERTDESIQEVYGPGYERKEKPEPMPTPLAISPKIAANDDEAERDQMLAEFAARDVAPLYCYRKLVNAKELAKWAKAQGFKQLVPLSEMHVTTLYSKTPVDWFDMADGWGWNERLEIGEGGPRKVEPLGDEGAVVLRFASDQLKFEHSRKIDKGASHDYEEYLPHITFTYDAGDVDLEKIEPFEGKLIFGPEYFEEISIDGFDPSLIGFTASESDAIDRLSASLAKETNPVMLEIGNVLKDSLEGVTSPEGVRIALLEAFEALPFDRMAQIAGLPLVAERMAAEAGIEELVDV